MQGSVLFDKVYGCIVGGLVGDAIGGPIEGMTASFIRQLHGGPVTQMLSYNTRPSDFFQPAKPSAYAWHSEPGTHTDDTYFATLITRCIIEKGGRITCEDLADFWLRECDDRRAWFSLNFSYKKLFYTHIPPRDLGQGNIGDNSSAMCIGPIGAINACDPAQAALDAYDVVSMMHWGHSRDAAGIIAAATAEAFRPDATVGSVAQAALDNIPGGVQSRMYQPMVLALDLARKAKDSEELTQLYYDQLIIEWSGRGKQVSTDGRHCDSCEAYESVPCALGMFVNAKGDFQKTIIGAANFGRDCDTIACMAGYIAGAYNGFDRIPQSWSAPCLAANPETPDFTQMAQDLTKALIAQQQRDMARVNKIAAMA